MQVRVHINQNTSTVRYTLKMSCATRSAKYPILNTQRQPFIFTVLLLNSKQTPIPKSTKHFFACEHDEIGQMPPGFRLVSC